MVEVLVKGLRRVKAFWPIGLGYIADELAKKDKCGAMKRQT
ncbi:MAG: hypothetical protein QGH94_15750 [Phycisphaerae bacterium]|jgi:hypothetical protein|nr:hypothetical protein [Phycisphaerae bacterium]